MTQISKNPVSADVYNKAQDLLVNSILKLKTKNQVSGFINEFFTPTERVVFAKRLTISLLLAKKYRYRDISSILKVSLATIVSVDSKYKHRRSLKDIIRRILNEEEMKYFWLSMAEAISTMGTVGRKGTQGWRYLKNEIQKELNKNPF
jgi:uncharacterized protein YerC